MTVSALILSLQVAFGLNRDNTHTAVYKILTCTVISELKATAAACYNYIVDNDRLEQALKIRAKPN